MDHSMLLLLYLGALQNSGSRLTAQKKGEAVGDLSLLHCSYARMNSESGHLQP